MEELKALKARGRILGIDFGKRYVGVAVSDPLFVSAQGICAIERKRADKLRQTLSKLRDICQEKEVGSIVIGFPKNMDGSLNERCEYTLEFADELFNRVKLPIYLFDERLTTKTAEDALNLMGKKELKQYVDEMSAMIILQGFMDLIGNENLLNFPAPYRS